MKYNLGVLPEFRSPDFDQQVFALVRKVPAGQVATYGQIAALLLTPPGVDEETYLAFRARWVGESLSRCPKDVPWQRVINSQGKISLSRSNQRLLLEAEGVRFNEKDRVNLKHYGWTGPEENLPPKLPGF